MSTVLEEDAHVGRRFGFSFASVSPLFTRLPQFIYPIVMTAIYSPYSLNPMTGVLPS